MNICNFYRNLCLSIFQPWLHSQRSRTFGNFHYGNVHEHYNPFSCIAILRQEFGKFKLSFLLTLLLSLLPILVFLLIPVSSDPRLPRDSLISKSSELLQSSTRRSDSFGSQQIDDEYRLHALANNRTNLNTRPLKIAEEEDGEVLLDNDQSQSVKISPKDNDKQSSPSSSEKNDSFGTSSGDLNSDTGHSKMDDLTTVLNVTDADIDALVKTFSKLTGRNYIVDSSVKGKITIHLPTPITLSEALKVFDSVLLLRGFATVPLSDNIWKVISAKDAKQTTIPMIGSKLSTEESLVTEVMKSTYLGADELQKVMSQFVSRDGYSQAISGTNLIIVVDTSSNILRIKKLMREIDIPPMDQDISIIPVKHALANDISEKINQILGTDNQQNESNNEGSFTNEILRRRLAATAAIATIQQPGQGPNSSSSSSAVRSNPTKIIPDERTNSLIVVADEFTTLKIQALVDQLDSELDKSSGRFWVYRLEHADAEELAGVLSGLISGGGASSGSGISQRGGGSTRAGTAGATQAGGISGNSRSSSRGAFGGGSGASRGSRARNQRAQGQSGIGNGITAGSGSSINTSGIAGLTGNSTRVTFQDEIAISPDISTNSLVINADKSDFDKLSQVIKALDVKRRQVLVEATILEVSLSDDQGLGVELQGTAATNSAGTFGQTNYGGLTNLLTNPAGLSDLTIAAASAGTLTLPGGIVIPSQAALITAVSSHSNVNVLSAPTILSTDNQEAEIIVGENVPFVTSTGVNQVNLGNTFNQIERQDVGITLRITPQIGTGDFLSLQIFVEISNVVPGTRNDPNGPTTTIRTSDTVVAVKNRQMIVTGGLIQDSVTESTRGVPYLQDVPVLGTLFRRQDEIKRRTNLLIFLTPQIIQDQYDLRDQTKERAKKMSSEIAYLEANPDRAEVLTHSSIDEVFESPDEDIFDNNIPLGIESNNAISDHLVDLNSDLNSDKNSNKVYSFQVQGLQGSSFSGLSGKSSPLANNSPEIFHDRTFIVLRSVGEISGTKLKLNEDMTAGIILPIDSREQKFFTPGSRVKNNDATFIVLGVYSEMDDAVKIHPDLKTWNEIQGSDLKTLRGSGWVFYD
ncbi:MAG TPA: type II secretion system secretin GspD [Oligoflexia bacterium]|nr:type II secretion system secretin GspD [Oligoflexia bacterium]HMP47928.1 type II secretion system secretin GspD [Oligoflexia bacterium]